MTKLNSFPVFLKQLTTSHCPICGHVGGQVIALDYQVKKDPGGNTFKAIMLNISEHLENIRYRRNAHELQHMSPY